MKTLLLLAEHPGAAEAVRAGVHHDEWRIVQRTELAECEPMLVHSLATACLLDTDANVQALWKIEQIRRWAPKCPVIVCTTNPTAEWIEEAYLKGAYHVLPKPFRGRLLAEVLQRLSAPEPAAAATETSFTVLPTATSEPQRFLPASGSQGLSILRGFSGILTHSLDSAGLLNQFLLFVRELFGLNRAMIFLPPDMAGSPGLPLRAAASLGVPHELLNAVELSFENGIGKLVSRSGRIVRCQSSQVAASPDARKQFEMLGADVAVPIPDRERVIGLALLDARVTGDPLTNSELELLFHLLEQLGLGLRNILLHQQLASNSQMLSGVLYELSSGCIVLDRNLHVLHANKAARRYFPLKNEDRARDLQFHDLPPEIGAKIYQVLRTGAALANYRMVLGEEHKTFRINIAPFQSQQDGAVQSVLLTAEDLTQAEHLKLLEIEAAELRVVRPMADRLSSEIGNAIVPIPVFAELLEERYADPAFRTTVKEGLAEASQRIERLVNQMRFLIGQVKTEEAPFELSALVEESFQDASRSHPGGKKPKLRMTLGEDLTIPGDRAMLKHAFVEIILNALQSTGNDPSITVRMSRDTAQPDSARIEFNDPGEGFTSANAKRAFEPFFTTKTVGVGLGLTVARRIIDAHGGRLEIANAEGVKGGSLCAWMPGAKAIERKKRQVEPHANRTSERNWDPV